MILFFIYLITLKIEIIMNLLYNTIKLINSMDDSMSDVGTVLSQPLLDIVAGYIVDRDYLIELIKSGNLPLIQWSHKITPGDYEGYEHCILMVACSENRLDIVVWIVEKFKITREQFMKCGDNCLGKLCRRGYGYEMKRLATYLNAMSFSDQYMYGNIIFKIVCANGYLDIAMWLDKTFNMTKEEFMMDNNRCFVYAVSNGDLKMIKWLISRFNLTINDCKECIPMLSKLIRGKKQYELEVWLKGK